MKVICSFIAPTIVLRIFALGDEKLPFGNSWSRRGKRRSWIASIHLTKTVAATTRKSRVSTSGGYRKGGESRQRIIKVALKRFDAAGYKGATTRQIASEARVTLPALQYYFGGKLGLYRACAEEVVRHYRHLVEVAAPDTIVTVDEYLDPAAARTQLKALIRTLATLPTQMTTWSQFVFREIGEPGPAFDVLYQGLWEPCVSFVARLIQQIDSEAADSLTARVQALLLLSSLLAFQGGQKFSLKIMGLEQMGETELAIVLAQVDKRIDTIGQP